MNNGKHTRAAVRHAKSEKPWRPSAKEYFCGAIIELFERDSEIKAQITKGAKTVFSLDCGETWHESAFPSW